uniref:Uncharacterized protein n=1 Tax=Solanum lycopersicum TaxID=4081 RepID=A0A3Q7HA12_SOLLC
MTYIKSPSPLFITFLTRPNSNPLFIWGNKNRTTSFRTHPAQHQNDPFPFTSTLLFLVQFNIIPTRCIFFFFFYKNPRLQLLQQILQDASAFSTSNSSKFRASPAERVRNSDAPPPSSREQINGGIRKANHQ